MCADVHVSERSKRAICVCRLQHLARPAYVVSVSTFEREMTVEEWKSKSKRNMEKGH